MAHRVWLAQVEGELYHGEGLSSVCADEGQVPAVMFHHPAGASVFSAE
jgi:hypothetical protein